MSRWILSSSIGLLLVSSGLSEIVFQADFKGGGTGTGGAQDVVALGGRGALKSFHNDSNSITAVSLISTKPPLGPGSFLNYALKVTGATGPGEAKAVTFTPNDAAHAWGGMAKVLGPQVFINGGFDFFTRVNKKDTGSVAWYRPVDVGDGKTQLRIDLSTVIVSGDEQLQLEIIGLGVVRGRAVGKYRLFPGSIYHLGASFSTDPTGNITAKLFAGEGVGALTQDHLIGSVTFQVDASPFSNTSELLPVGEFGFGGSRYDSGAAEVNIDYALFRLYNSAPQSFAELPH